MTFEKETKEKVVEELTKKWSDNGRITDTIINYDEAIDLTHKYDMKRVEEAIDKKIKEFKDWMEENPQKDGIYLVAEGCVKVLEELKEGLGIDEIQTN